MDSRLAQLEKLRTHRVWQRDVSLGPELARQTKALARLHKSLAGIGEQWGTILPRDLARRTSIEGLSRGVLTVRVPDAATDYELDRWVRGGGLESLRRAGANIVKVKTLYSRRAYV